MSNIWESFVKIHKELTGCDTFSKGIYFSHYQRVLFMRRSQETTLRFLIKALISKILYDENISFITEWKYHVNNKVFDNIPIMDLTNMKIYRFGKSKLSMKHKKFKEQNINLQSLKTDLQSLKELEKELRERLNYEKQI